MLRWAFIVGFLVFSCTARGAINATVSGTTATVTWSVTVPPEDGAISSYAKTVDGARSGDVAGSASSGSFTLTGLGNGSHTVSVTVQAAYYDGDGDYAGTQPISSGSATFTITAGAPGVPTGLAATAASSGANVGVSWTAVDGATSYSLYRGGTLLSSQAATTYTDASVVLGTTYSYAVLASNAGGSSAQSAAVSVTLPNVPGAPTGVTAVMGSDGKTAVIQWTAVTGAGNGYNVYRDGTLVPPVGGSTAGTGFFGNFSASPAYDAAPGAPGTTHSYTVVAYSDAGPSAASAGASLRVPAIPLAVTGFTGSPGSTSVALSWSAVSDAYAYKISKDGGSTWIPTITTTTYNDTGLTPSTQYTYTIVAWNAQGDSPPTSINVTTQAAGHDPVPGSGSLIPQNVKVYVVGNSINVTWDNFTAGQVLAAGVPWAANYVGLQATYYLIIDGNQVVAGNGSAPGAAGFEEPVDGVYSVAVYGIAYYGVAGQSGSFVASGVSASQNVTVGNGQAQAFVISVTSSTVDSATVTWPAGSVPSVYGYDFLVDGQVVYESRLGATGSPPTLDPTTSFTFSGLTPGSTVTFEVDAHKIGEFGNSVVKSNSAKWRVGSSVATTQPSTQPASTQPAPDLSGLPGTKWGQVQVALSAWLPAMPMFSATETTSWMFSLPLPGGDSHCFTIDWSSGAADLLRRWIRDVMAILFILGLVWRVMRDLRSY